MTDNQILEVLKIDLGITAEIYNKILLPTIESARAAITREGIKINDNIEDGMLIENYAAYLYRKRKEDVPMPRSLRWRLNNRLFSQKASEDSG